MSEAKFMCRSQLANYGPARFHTYTMAIAVCTVNITMAIKCDHYTQIVKYTVRKLSDLRGSISPSHSSHFINVLISMDK